MTEWTERAKQSVEVLKGYDFNPLQSFVEKKSKLKISLEDEDVDEIDSGRQSGLAISAVDGQNTNFFCYSSPEEFDQEVEYLPSLIGVQSNGTDQKWRDSENYQMPVEKNLDTDPTEAKKERLLNADRVARQLDDRVSQVKVIYSEKHRDIEVFDSEGWIRDENQQYVNFIVQVIAEDDGNRERGHARSAGFQGEEIFDDRSPRDIAEKAADQAVTALEAEPVEPGPRTVVIAPGFGGTIFHEACGHGFEADHIYEDVSRYAGKMGEKVASDNITFVDDGSIDNNYGSFKIDDEGTPSNRSVLIEDGVMKGLMSDRKYANLLDVSPSGNGRRQSFNYPILPRMTNTYIEAGESNPDDIISSTDEGIYAAHIGGGQVDPASGDFIFSITEGYLIEDGEITSPIRDAALVGNGPEVLKRIDAVGNDLDLRPGICGKGQWVPVTVGQPTLRVQDLTVGGQD